MLYTFKKKNTNRENPGLVGRDGICISLKL